MRQHPVLSLLLSALRGAAMRRVPRVPVGARRAFTLIELLVVISIIAVLAALLLPAIGLVRDQARAVVCSKHMGQVGLAHIAYGGDNDGAIPWPANYTQANPQLFSDYISTSDHVWSCTVPELNSHWYHVPYAWKFYMNWRALEPDLPASHYVGHTRGGYVFSRVRDTTTAVLCSDLQGGGLGGYHRGRSNLVMLDGHVERRPDESATIAPGLQWAWSDPGRMVTAEFFAERTWDAKMKGWDY